MPGHFRFQRCGEKVNLRRARGAGRARAFPVFNMASTWAICIISVLSDKDELEMHSKRIGNVLRRNCESDANVFLAV